ncbi:aldolase/citrate lyase family protein [Campylobacter lari]|nr:aldolase/citrate lyase family protein [Campylobacter lari]
MYKTEIEFYKQLCKLRDEYDLQGIKAEFEAEGSSFRDLVRLRRLTSQANVKLYLKIGGVEAIRDIKDSLEIGVDGIIAPMVESKFGVKKFYDSLKCFYCSDTMIHTTLNIETRGAIENLEDILNFAYDKFDNITIGRTDLSRSYFADNITPDSEFIFKILSNISEYIMQGRINFTMGGGLSAKTIELINTKYGFLKNMIKNMETRKVILPTNVLLSHSNAIREALKLEELYILSKKDFSDMKINSELSRLTELQRRV